MINNIEYSVLKAIKEHENDDIRIPVGMDERVFCGISKSLHDRKLIHGAFVEGGELYAARIENEGVAAIFEYENEIKQRRIEMKVDMDKFTEDEIRVLEFLSAFDDYTEERPEGMTQKEYEDICHYLKENGLVEITETKDGFWVIEMYKGRKLLKKYNKQAASRPEIHETEEKMFDAQPSYHDKVRLELTLKFLEQAGIDLEKHGNKAKTARILQTITGLPISTCKNYCTNRDLSHEIHSSEISDINSELEKLGVIFRI